MCILAPGHAADVLLTDRQGAERDLMTQRRRSLLTGRWKALCLLPHLRLAAALRPHNLLRLAAPQRREDVKSLQQQQQQQKGRTGNSRPEHECACSVANA